MNKRFVKQLCAELPALVEAGILNGETAGKLREYYGEKDGRSMRHIGLIICSVLGSVLIGAGLILLLAHNWKDLSRPVRTMLSIGPLLLCQLLALWGILKEKTSVPWRESIATFIMLAAGSSIALIGQTYHIPGDAGAFLMTWSLISIPLVYIFRATTPCGIYLGCITAWSGYVQSQQGHALLFWLLFALAVPHLVQALRKDRYSQRSIVLQWLFALCLCVSVGITLEKVLPGLWIIIYSSLFAIFYLIGTFWFRDAPRRAQRPLLIIGTLGVVFLSLLFTYEFPWDDAGWRYYRYASRYHTIAAWVDYLLTAAMPTVTLLLLVTAVRRRAASAVVFGSFPLLCIVSFALCSFESSELFAMIIFNLYTLLLGVWCIVTGMKRRETGTVNGGMAIVCGLIVCRFFDVDIGFVVRGLAFIIVGTGFLATNLVMARKQKGSLS